MKRYETVSEVRSENRKHSGKHRPKKKNRTTKRSEPLGHDAIIGIRGHGRKEGGWHVKHQVYGSL